MDFHIHFTNSNILIVFMKTGFLAMEGKRPQTRLQIKMAKEETRTRLAKVENQRTQMVAMMIEMRLLFSHLNDFILLLQM